MGLKKQIRTDNLLNYLPKRLFKRNDFPTPEEPVSFSFFNKILYGFATPIPKHIQTKQNNHSCIAK